MVSPRLFLFDIDGTILRGGTAVHRDAFAHVFRTVYGRPLSLEGVVAAGRTDTWLLVESLRASGLTDAEIWAKMPHAFTVMQDFVEQHLGDLRACVLPGVREVLAILHQKGCLLGLLTGNVSGIAHAKMRQAGLSHCFVSGGFGEESVERADLVPIAVAHASQSFGISLTAGDAVLIGDTPLDVAAGKAHRAFTCAVATGTFGVDALHATKPDLLLESLQDHVGATDQLLRIGT